MPQPEFSLAGALLVRHTYLMSKHGAHRDVTHIVIPEQLVPTILHHIHSTPHAGHPGRNRTLLQACLLYYWSRMCIDIINYIDNCHACAENHGSVGKAVPTQSYPIPTKPWETIAIALLTLPLTIDGHWYLLVVIDHFSRFGVLVPLKNKTATSVAQALIDEVFCKFNMPRTLVRQWHGI